MKIETRIKTLQKAIEELREAGMDLQPGTKQREVVINMTHYMGQDMRVLLHTFGLEL